MGSVNFVKLKRKNYYSFIIFKNYLNASFFEKSFKNSVNMGRGKEMENILGGREK